MLPWMIYAVLTSLFIGIAAVIGTHAARQRQRPTRWIWLTAMMLSTLLPFAIAFVSIQVPQTFRTATQPGLVALRDATSIAMPAVMFDLGNMEEDQGSSHAIDISAGRIWLTLSASLFMLLAVTAGLLQRRKHRWEKGSLCGTDVRFSQNVGPAVIGVLRPTIVVPKWLTQAPVAQQQHVVAHESAHLRAGDPHILALALGCLSSFRGTLHCGGSFIDCDALSKSIATPASCETAATYASTAKPLSKSASTARRISAWQPACPNRHHFSSKGSNLCF